MRRSFLVASLVSLIAACGGSAATAPASGVQQPGAGFPSGPLVLTVSPIDLERIRWITPLGHLNPPQHTLPTDHIYFYFADPDAAESAVDKRTTFRAPGHGTVTRVFGGAVGQESKLFIRQTSTFSYYVDHLILTAPMVEGAAITAGQVLGTTGSAYAVDLGVVNDSVAQGFLNPSRYVNSDSLHADAPLKYFAAPLRAQLYDRVQRLGADRDGIINHDIRGRLSGNWFSTLDGSHLTFATATYDPSRVLIAIQTGTTPGVFGIAPTDLLPSEVSVASERVLYHLHRSNSGPRSVDDTTRWWLLVQLTSETQLRLEMFTAPPADFTAAARTFAR